MAIPLQFQLLITVFLLISVANGDGGATATTASSTYPAAPPSGHRYYPTLFATIFSALGFNELSTATVSANLSATTPLTVFAPTDTTLLTCPSCSLPILLHELSIPGLYPLRFLQSLAFGTKIETLASDRCLTITTTSAGSGRDNGNETKVFVNGVEITRPDLFNNGFVIIHGIQGFVSHLSPLSCNIERMTSLSFPSASRSTSPAAWSSSVMRVMLKDAIYRLGATGYTAVSLALRVKFAELSELKAATVFALDDATIFSGGGNAAYLANFRFHVVPNRRLAAAELVSLPAATVLPTMDVGQSLVVTTAGGGGLLAPLKINYVKIKSIDLLHNSKIVFHGIAFPFPHMHHPLAENDIGFAAAAAHFHHGRSCGDGVCPANESVPPGINSAVDLDDHHGL